MVKKILGIAINRTKANLITLRKVIGAVMFRLALIIIGLFGLMFLALIFQSQHLMFLAAGAACAAFIAIHWTLVGTSEVISVVLDKIASREKNEKELERNRAKLERLAVGMKRFCDLFVTATMFVAGIACWTLTMGFGNMTIGTLEVIAMASLVFLAIGLFKKEEQKWPRWLIGGMTLVSLVFWFGTLDTVPSRVVGSVIGMQTIATEEAVDKRIKAVAICDAVLYSINARGNLEEAVSADTMLHVGQVVRLTNAQLKTRRFDGKLFAEIAIERANGRDDTYWVKPSALSKGSGLEIYPSLADPQYGIKKEKQNGKEVWTISFLTDERISFPTPVGKWYTLSGIESHELWAMYTNPQNPNAGEMGNDLKAGVKYYNPDANSTLQAKKGTVLYITWSNS